MIHVMAKARIRPGQFQHVLACYQELVPLILANEPGCLAYIPTADVNLGLANQEVDNAEILVMEQWRSLDDFRRHLRMPHCLAFRQKILPALSAGITVRITQDCLPDDHTQEEAHVTG